MRFGLLKLRKLNQVNRPEPTCGPKMELKIRCAESLH